jgi:signal transduction histidine kinase
MSSLRGLLSPLARHARWTGLVAGLVVAAFDLASARRLGVTFELSGRDATNEIGLFLAVSFGGLGLLIGYLVELRRREREALERVRTQSKRLDDLRRRLAQTEKLAVMGQLSAAIAHELRNPLAIMRSSLQNLEEEADDADEVRRVCGFVREEIDRINRVASSILGFARPLEPQLVGVGVDEVLRRVELLTPPEIHEKHIAFEVVDHTRGARIVADGDLLGQALLGLVDNAAKASPARGRVVLEAGREGDDVVLAVRDSGPGVPDAERGRIFEAFYSTRADGHGLGLAVAREIASVNGAALAVLDNEGGGACFTVTLPAGEAAL